MIIPLGERYQQVFHLFEKQDGKLVKKKLIPTLFVPMTGTAEENRAMLPDPSRPEIVNGGFEADENGDGRVDNWHYQRQVTHITGGAPQGESYIRIENTEPGRSAQLLQGFPIDGTQVGTLDVAVLINLAELGRGSGSFEPALLVHFYDETRRMIASKALDRWTETDGWEKKQELIAVPTQAREAVLRVGLNGATGLLAVDDVHIVAGSR